MTKDPSNQTEPPPAILDGLARFRLANNQDGTDLRGVLRWLRDHGLYAAADWLEKNPERHLELAARSNSEW